MLLVGTVRMCSDLPCVCSDVTAPLICRDWLGSYKSSAKWMKLHSWHWVESKLIYWHKEAIGTVWFTSKLEDSARERERERERGRGRERERNVLFNDTLNTFYLRLYGIRHMVKDHSDSEKGNPLPPHRLLLSINSKGSFICTIPQTG